jgi:glycosyltransferase involved in cell wall biosynthesis
VKIVFVHLLNNFSGSPKVLSLIVDEFVGLGYDIDLITSKTDGFLSNIKGVRYKYNNYKWITDSIFKTALYLMLSQVKLFFMILFYPSKNTVFYINTISPVGAVVACKITKKKFIYHVHENMMQNKPVYILYRNIYKICNKKSIFVSNYLKSVALSSKNSIVVYNTLDYEFIKRSAEFLNIKSKFDNNSSFSILMVSSLRRYKGVYEFVELSKKLPDYKFELVLSVSENEVMKFIQEVIPSGNITVYSLQTNLHPFYQRAKILLQLSHSEDCIETFGLTILEAASYGIPSIVPNVGGPTEIVDSDKNGFCVDTHNLDDIADKIKLLMNDDVMYSKFSSSALSKSKQFDLNKSINMIENYIFS